MRTRLEDFGFGRSLVRKYISAVDRDTYIRDTCQHVRVGKAREMLEFTNGTVDHIAWTVGYQDPAAFRSTFKKITGLAPSEYRNKFGVGTPVVTARG